MITPEGFAYQLGKQRVKRIREQYLSLNLPVPKDYWKSPFFRVPKEDHLMMENFLKKYPRESMIIAYTYGCKAEAFSEVKGGK